MKSHRPLARHLWFFGPAILALAMPAAAQSGVSTNEPPVVPRSVFVQPNSPAQGRDPFFPNSVRPYATAVAAPVMTKDLSAIVLRGISGSPDHRLAIINSVTFGVGDEADVFTSKGRIRVKCLDITEDSAVIEAFGQRRVLNYTTKP